MKELPAYSGANATCVKCGWRGADTAYKTSERTVDGCEIYAAVPTPRLERSCRRCGYRWDEATL